MFPSNAKRTRFEHANPILRVGDLARSVRYYVDALGFVNADWGGDDFTCVTRDGAIIVEPPRNFPWARELKIGDPDGHVLRLGSDPHDEA